MSTTTETCKPFVCWLTPTRIESNIPPGELQLSGYVLSYLGIANGSHIYSVKRHGMLTVAFVDASRAAEVLTAAGIDFNWLNSAVVKEIP